MRYWRTGAGAILLSWLALSSVVAAEGRGEKSPPGFVDGSEFVDFADAASTGTVEVSLSGALLKALLGGNADLEKLAGGLQSIRAVITSLETEEQRDRARELVGGVEKRLRSRGWERVTRIKDEGATFSVWVLNDEETILGLCVLGLGEDGELVFANIAGVIDMKAIADLGEELDIPGLDQLGE